VKQYNVSPIALGYTSPKAWPLLIDVTFPKHKEFDGNTASSYVGIKLK